LTTWNGRVPAFRIAANVRGGGRETTETLHQGQQGADDDEAEQHVKQQLLVRPLRAVGRHAELINDHVAEDDIALLVVHHTGRLPGDVSTSRGANRGQSRTIRPDLEASAAVVRNAK
jgi:hypothetical protein